MRCWYDSALTFPQARLSQNTSSPFELCEMAPQIIQCSRWQISPANKCGGRLRAGACRGRNFLRRTTQFRTIRTANVKIWTSRSWTGGVINNGIVQDGWFASVSLWGSWILVWSSFKLVNSWRRAQKCCGINSRWSSFETQFRNFKGRFSSLWWNIFLAVVRYRLPKSTHNICAKGPSCAALDNMDLSQ